MKRFSQLVGYEKKYFHYDMRTEQSLDCREIERIKNSSGDNNMIFGFDEFQHIPQVETPMEDLWDLLDSGLISTNSYPKNFFHLNALRQKLENALKHGVEVVEGKVVKGHKLFKKIVIFKHKIK